jgi:hypothetical protein
MPTFEMEACEGCSIEINKEVRAPEQGRFTTRNYRLLCFLELQKFLLLRYSQFRMRAMDESEDGLL